MLQRDRGLSLAAPSRSLLLLGLAFCVAVASTPKARAQGEVKPAIGRWIEGMDKVPQPMPMPEVAALTDAWAGLVVRRGQAPATIEECLAVLDLRNEAREGVPEQAVYLISETGQIAF